MQNEEWRLVPRYNGKLEASSLGRIRKTWGGELVPMHTSDKTGHSCIWHRANRKKHTLRVDRLVALAWLGEISQDEEVIYKNDDLTDNRPANLWIAWKDVEGETPIAPSFQAAGNPLLPSRRWRGAQALAGSFGRLPE